MVREDDVEYILRRFEEEYQASQIANKMTLDTSDSTVESTVAEFVEKMEPYFTVADRLEDGLTPPALDAAIPGEPGHRSATTGLLSVPIPSTSTSTVSPTFISPMTGSRCRLCRPGIGPSPRTPS